MCARRWTSVLLQTWFRYDEVILDTNTNGQISDQQGAAMKKRKERQYGRCVPFMVVTVVENATIDFGSELWEERTTRLIRHTNVVRVERIIVLWFLTGERSGPLG